MKTPCSIELDDFPLGNSSSAVPGEREGLPRPRKGELFLGPMPMSWIERAAPLPGRAWHLGTALFFEACCSRQATVRLPANTLRRFGLGSRNAVRRALEALRKAKLIRIAIRPGKRPLVTILPVSPKKAKKSHPNAAKRPRAAARPARRFSRPRERRR
jgi:hypothetical protein